MRDDWNAERMKELRKRSKLTQEEVMAATGVHYNTIAYIEAGRRVPQAKTLQRLLQLYSERIKYWKQLSAELGKGKDRDGE